MNKCGKKRFKTREQADSRAQRINSFNSKIKSKARLESYRCPKCRKFHLTSKVKASDEEYAKAMRIRNEGKAYWNKTKIRKRQRREFIEKEGEHWIQKINRKTHKKRRKK